MNLVGCFRAILGLSLATVSLSVAVASEPADPAEMVFINGKVFTAEEDGTLAEAFAVRDGRFVAVGSNDEVEPFIAPSTEVIDLAGRFVSPGLADAHFHTEGGGPYLDLSKVESMAELLDVLRQAAQEAKPGELIMTNADWHEMQLAERRLPLATELDTVTPDNPVVVFRGGHSLILNSAALEKWGITADTVSPEGGQITKDAQGRLTGELFDNAKELVDLPPSPPVTVEDARTTQRVLNSYGITSARVIGGYKTDSVTAWKLFSELKEADDLTVRYNVFLRNAGPRNVEGASPGQVATEFVQGLEAAGLRQGEGDEWLRIGGIKLIVDGGFEGGLMFEPYAEPYGRGGTYYGLRTVPVPVFNEIVSELHERGWVIATHAAGDAALGMVLDAYRLAHEEKPIDRERWAVEHAFLTNPEQIELARDLGIVLSVQNHLFVAGPAFKNYLGEPRATRITPLDTYLDAGLPVALGTDSPVIPVNPFWELYHYVTRDTRSDGVYGPEERVLDREKLLRTMTAGYAFLTGEEAIKGTISVGKLADFAVLSDDFLTIEPEGIKDMRALATFVDGRQVYRDSSWR